MGAASSLEVEVCLLTKVGEFVETNAEVDAAPMTIAADTGAIFTIVEYSLIQT